MHRLLMGATVCREQPGNGACLGVQDTLKHHTGSGSQLGPYWGCWAHFSVLRNK